MGVHSQRDGLVAVAQVLGHAGDIRAVGDGYGGVGVTELVRVETGYTLPAGELLQVAGGALRVHGFIAPVLSEHIRAQRTVRLFALQGF